MKPATTLQLKGNGTTVCCGQCNAVLATAVYDAFPLIEGYVWTEQPSPHYSPSRRLIERHRYFRRMAHGTGEKAERAREKLRTGQLGGKSGERVTSQREDGTPSWSYWQTSHQVSELRSIGSGDGFNLTAAPPDPVICVECGTLNAVPQNLLSSRGSDQAGAN